MDGTLVDTEPLWHRAEVWIVEGYGRTWTHEQTLPFIGKPILDSAAEIVRVTGIPLSPQEMCDRMVEGLLALEATEGLPWRPGAPDLLTALRDAGIPCAVVTSSFRRLTTHVVGGAPMGALAGVVSADDVANLKPHPEPYLAGAALLGLDPARCVAIEDSTSGSASALAAGCRTIAVPDVADVAARPGLSFAASLAQLDLDVLARIAGGETLDLRPARG